MIVLDYDTAEEFVNRNDSAHWEGWTIVLFKPSAKAMRSVRGTRYNGEWGFDKRIRVNNDGKWRVPTEFVNTS